MVQNCAYLFIKPHAVTEPTKELVSKGLAAKGLTIVSEGALTAKQIDEGMLIDNHYYAIASKATILKPHQLAVPAPKFAAKFGIGWQEALDKGIVYNAKDACEYLGLDAEGLNTEWAKAKKAKKLIKFGGGFYCGLIDTVAGKDPIYAFNGFFMSMRSSYVAPGASIYYYVVSWDSSTASWSDFRTQILGPTDPADAPADSLRGMIKDQWKSLELKSEPNVGDNGVHASASPFEALSERINWLGAKLEDDAFGSALLKAGITAETFKAWSVDPRVTYGAPAMPIQASLFDSLEDMDSDECLAKCILMNTKVVRPAAGKNSAFLFIKPHAVTEPTKALVSKGLAAKGLTILQEGALTAKQIDEGMLIDNHYYAIASKATILKPHELAVPPQKFKNQFGLDWQAALDKGVVYNAKDACEFLGLDSEGLNTEWAKAKKAKKLVKFGGGFYCGLIDTVAGKDPIYVFNGFFMSMRSAYVAPGASIYYYVVEWDQSAASWDDFRGKILGPTDPADAPADSLRGMIKNQWEALELKSEPNIGENGVHASASPFEALAERVNWLGAKVEEDSFGVALMSAGVDIHTIKKWSVDPRVTYGAPTMPIKASLFDSVEDQDSDQCLARLVLINQGVEECKLSPAAGKNQAYLFIKPHAVTEATKALVTKGLAAKGLKILQEGALTAKQIDDGMLIDNHYYAIASKATILKPNQLAVPAPKFAAKFGLGWQEALDKGVVYNAKDACEYLGLDAEGLNTEWAKAKKAKKLIKFGGGFYCGLIDTVAGKDPIYAFNGFFMSMRSSYVAPGASIYYYVVEWDQSTASWDDFRGKILGPTDPADAPVDSLRGMIKDQWKDLGLKSEPNVGENGVHASASPFEALCERVNWLGAKVEEDPFGAALLAAGVSADTFKEWSLDPRVTYGAKAMPITGSLFDSVEDTDSDECLARLLMITAPSADKKINMYSSK